MKIKRVMVMLEDGRRMFLYPEGGMGLEMYINGFGWCAADDHPEMGNDNEQAAMLDEAAALLTAKAQDLLLSSHWTAEEILMREA